MTDAYDPFGAVRQAYDKLVKSGEIKSDPTQLELTHHLDNVLKDIATKRLSSKSSALGWLFGKRAESNPVKNGLYIWGGVGRGKSFLMDLFFEVAQVSPKRRVHFNDFMQEAHHYIHDHRKAHKAGKSDDNDPIPPVARKIAKKARLLCFDEFSVSDIADAMLLARLFKVLFEEGVVVVATSNIKPEDLYLDGLNRQLFLPFVDLLTSQLNIHQMKDGIDYRLDKVSGDKYYSWPLNEHTARSMDDIWHLITDGAKAISETITVKGRALKIPRAAKTIARFDFNMLCRQPLGIGDYLAIAERYSTIMIDDIPILSASERNEAKRFIGLIDVLYDNHCRLIVSADGPPHMLYQAISGREAFEFDRTTSRLIEMQSIEYNRP